MINDSRTSQTDKFRGKLKLVIALLLLAGAVAVGWSFRSPILPAMSTTQDFFTDDDGVTWFQDEGDRIAPFQHDGKTAVKAAVYQAANGKQFVGFLLKFTDEARGKIEETKRTHVLKMGPSAGESTLTSGMVVKRPGDLKWVAIESLEASKVMAVKGPDGDLNVTTVSP